MWRRKEARNRFQQNGTEERARKKNGRNEKGKERKQNKKIKER
jgi:hypothetical protein